MSEKEIKELWVSVGQIKKNKSVGEHVSKIVFITATAKKKLDEALTAAEAWVKEAEQGETRTYHIAQVDTN